MKNQQKEHFMQHTEPCRLVVILDSELHHASIQALKELVTPWVQEPAITFIAGIERSATLPLGRLWPSVFYNAHEFLSYHQHVATCTWQFNEIWFVRTGEIRCQHTQLAVLVPNFLTPMHTAA